MDWSSDVCSSVLKKNSQWTIWTTIFPQSICGKETPAVPRTRWTETGPEASPRTVKSLNHLSGTTNRSRQRNGPIWKSSKPVRQATLANKARGRKQTGGTAGSSPNPFGSQMEDTTRTQTPMRNTLYRTRLKKKNTNKNNN